MQTFAFKVGFALYYEITKERSVAVFLFWQRHLTNVGYWHLTDKSDVRFYVGYRGKADIGSGRADVAF